MHLTRIALLLAALTTQSCVMQTTDPQTQASLLPPTTSIELFQQPADLPELEQLFYLNDKQQQDFLSYFHSAAQAAHPAEQRLYNFLQNKLMYFNYEGANYPAQVAMEQFRGNCMTLALLTSALAQLANIEVGYKVIYQEPLIDYKDNIFISSNHIRTYLYKEAAQPQKGKMVLQRAALVIDYFPENSDFVGENISSARFHAMLYNNLAADALLQGDSDKAFFLSQKALQQDQTYTPAVNMVALMYHRKKAFAEALQWFDYGMQLQDNQITLLTNYRDLAAKTDNQQLLEKINQQIMSHDDDNPYAWLALAIDAERNQQFSHAKLYYKKLLEKAPYLHNANLALIRLYLQEQNFIAAQKLVEQAIHYAYEPERLKLYNTKLAALKQHRKTMQQTH
jgi:Tfp pilus assembly protein PilF